MAGPGGPPPPPGPSREKKVCQHKGIRFIITAVLLTYSDHDCCRSDCWDSVRVVQEARVVQEVRVVLVRAVQVEVDPALSNSRRSVADHLLVRYYCYCCYLLQYRSPTVAKNCSQSEKKKMSERPRPMCVCELFQPLDKQKQDLPPSILTVRRNYRPP